MNLKDRLDILWGQPPIYIKQHDPIVVFSDYHMNDQGKMDYFYPNYKRYLEVLTNYIEGDWTVIVTGDMEDAWKYPNVKDIRSKYRLAYDLHEKLQAQGRFFRVTGNHDIQLGYPQALVLDHPVGKFFFVHGFQGDFIDDTAWPLGMMLVRYFVAPIEKMGYKDPLSVSKNATRHAKVEAGLIAWANNADLGMTGMICGHTHSQKQQGRYWNVGCEMHASLECIEINKTIQLRMW